MKQAACRSFVGAPLFLLFIRFGWDKLQQIADFTLQYRTQSSQYINIQASNGVVTIVIDLCPLHLRALAEFVFADAVFLNEL